MKLKEFFCSRRVKNGGSAMALVALVVAIFYVVNLILLGLANHFSWYFYTTEQYEITVSGAADELLNGIRTPQGKVKILFCDVEENVKNHQQLDFVYKTDARKKREKLVFSLLRYQLVTAVEQNALSRRAGDIRHYSYYRRFSFKKALYFRHFKTCRHSDEHRVFRVDFRKL